jgi:hypothetical protein
MLLLWQQFVCTLSLEHTFPHKTASEYHLYACSAQLADSCGYISTESLQLQESNMCGAFGL